MDSSKTVLFEISKWKSFRNHDKIAKINFMKFYSLRYIFHVYQNVQKFVIHFVKVFDNSEKMTSLNYRVVYNSNPKHMNGLH